MLRDPDEQYVSCVRCGKDIDVEMDEIRTVSDGFEGKMAEFSDEELAQGVFCEDCGYEMMEEDAWDE